MTQSITKQLKNKRIFIVFRNFEVGGAERQGLHVARFLKDACGAKVQILGLQSTPGQMSEECDKFGITWQGIELDWPVESYRLWKRINSLRKFAKLLRGQQPDILIPYTYLPNIVCGLTWKYTGARVCIWNQRDEGLFLNRWPLHRLAVNSTPFFLTNADASRRFLENFYGLDENRIEIVRNGISLPSPVEDRKTWRKLLNAPDNSFIVCMLANIHGRKDHLTLLKSWRLFLDRTAHSEIKPFLCLAGRIDEGAVQLKEIIKELDIAETVRLAGKVSDVAGLLQAIDLLVHSSRSEGLPNAVLEAMAVGLPVVATDIPGNREAVGPAGQRFLTPPGDPVKMADHLEYFFCNPAMRTIVGSELQKRARKEFDIRKMCAATASLIANMIDMTQDSTGKS